MLQDTQNPFKSIKLIALDQYFDEMVNLFELKILPKVLLLNGKKGIGKFTLIFHFLNYIYSKKEETNYNLKDKLINNDSSFYKSILNQTNNDVLFLQAEEGKNIKIDSIRNLKSTLSRSSLSDNPRFMIIDEVEFLNMNSANALLKTLEEPSSNNYFILINNQQADLIETISSRCLKNNIYLNSENRKKLIDFFFKNKKIDLLIDDSDLLTPGMLLKYNHFSSRYKIDQGDNITLKLNKLLYGYKKDKNKALISMSFFLIEQFFYKLVVENKHKTFSLLGIKSIILNKINDFTIYNLNVNSVLNSINLNLKNVR
jgi:DNA polymerase-3 subunit delta'